MPLLAQIAKPFRRIGPRSWPNSGVPTDAGLESHSSPPHDLPDTPEDGHLSSPIPRPPWSPAGGLRDHLAREFIRGRGIELGALWNPLSVPREAHVTYVDRCDADEFRKAHSENAHIVNGVPLVHVDIIDDAETLATMGSSSYDFIISCHLLEHTQDPIRTIKRNMEVLKPNGVLFMSVPDKRLTFDRHRPETTLEHLYRDHEEGPELSFLDHMREWVELAEHKTGAQAETRIQELVQQSIVDIHYHVWTQDSLAEMLVDLRKRLALPFDIEAIVLNRQLIESICILRKVG
jgi:SAM-dependent methyltransferase